MHSKPTSAQLLLSPNDGPPMYQQVVDQITMKVASGDWPPGAALPSIRELASTSQVSVITVKRAYQELERAGVIVTRQGLGSFVAESTDASRSLLQQEFERSLQAMLQAARRLDLSIPEIQQMLERERSTGD